jgi:hypothetical protein
MMVATPIQRRQIIINLSHIGAFFKFIISKLVRKAIRFR